jgi:hypothetical protein
MGGARLLPHRIPHGLRPMLRLHRFGLRDHSAGAFLVWLSKAPAHPDIFCFFSYRQDFWRNYWSDPHGPVHRRAGETSLKPSGASRAAGKLDYRRKHPATSKLAQAKENLARISDEVEVKVQTAWNKLDRTREMVNVSQQILTLRTESTRVTAQELLIEG